MKYAVAVILTCLLFSCSNANDLDDYDTHHSHYEPKFSLEEHQELRFFKPFDDSSIIGGPRSFGLCDLTHDSDSLVLMEVTSTSDVVPLCSVDKIEGKYRTSYLTFDVALIEKISGTETPTYFDSIRFLHLGTENFQQGDVVLGSLRKVDDSYILIDYVYAYPADVKDEDISQSVDRGYKYTIELESDVNDLSSEAARIYSTDFESCIQREARRTDDEFRDYAYGYDRYGEGKSSKCLDIGPGPG